MHDFNGKYYRPIPILLMEVVFLFFGNSPFPFHFISLILHLGNLFLIYIVTNRLFEKKLSPFLTISIMMLFSPIYYEIFFWVATYFELLFVTFGLISIYYFLKYLKTENTLDFLISAFFVSLSVLSKETALFIIPLYGFFELTESESFKLFMKEKSLKYLSFLPIIALFTFVRLATNRFFPTIQNFLDPLRLAILIGGLVFLIPLYLWMKKIETPTKKFTILFALIYSVPLIFHRTSRIFYFPCVVYSILLVFLFLDNYDLNVLPCLRQIDLRRKKNIFLVFAISGLIIGSSFYLQYSKNIYKIKGNSMENISLQIALMAPNSAKKSIYILYLPWFGHEYFGFAEQEIRQNLRLIMFQDYDINAIYILDMNPRYLSFNFLSIRSPYQYYLSIGAEPKSVKKYNNITQDSDNLMLLYSIDLNCVFDISGVLID